MNRKIANQVEFKLNMMNFTRRLVTKQKLRGISAIFSRRSYADIYKNEDDAVADIPHGSTIAMGGFALVGIPENLINAIGRKGTMDLTCISNDVGLNKYGVDLLVRNKQVKKIICSFLGENKNIVQDYFNGHIELELVPQGSFVEKLRAAGAGIPAFYTNIEKL